MKLCTVIAYYITSITNELKSLNSNCFIVCIYCSVVCLTVKGELKIIKLSNSFKLNKIDIVDSPFNENPKNIIFSRENIISREGWPENLKIMANNGHLLLCKSRVVNFEREYQPLTPGNKILVMPQFCYMPDRILGKK